MAPFALSIVFFFGSMFTLAFSTFLVRSYLVNTDNTEQCKLLMENWKPMSYSQADGEAMDKCLDMTRQEMTDASLLALIISPFSTYLLLRLSRKRLKK